MKTKLVYVLTCAPEASYIEQALMAVWSARYWNPDAHIVLLTDDKTSAILHTDNTRGEILRYISEEIVSTFDSDKSMHYRSRWIKTSARELVDGDMLFIDCDTICCSSLATIDKCDADVAAVLDEHLHRREYVQSLDQSNNLYAVKIGFDYLQENDYFNSGVVFWRDSEQAHLLGHIWHKEWLLGVDNGVQIDQTSLGKANSLCGHVIKELSGVWNTIVFMHPKWIRNSKIIHFWNYRNESFMYSTIYLRYVQLNGIDEYVSDCILNPIESLPPFKTMYSTLRIQPYWHKRHSILQLWRKLKNKIDVNNESLPWHLNKLEWLCLNRNLYGLGASLYILRFYIHCIIHPIKSDLLWG